MEHRLSLHAIFAGSRELYHVYVILVLWAKNTPSSPDVSVVLFLLLSAIIINFKR